MLSLPTGQCDYDSTSGSYSSWSCSGGVVSHTIYSDKHCSDVVDTGVVVPEDVCVGGKCGVVL